MMVKNLLKKIILMAAVVFFTGVTNPQPALAAQCSGGSLMGFPSWYTYLECETINGKQTPMMEADRLLPNLLLIGMAIVELLLRISGILAIAYVTWGGIKYITSQGSPEGTKAARETITQALIGLVIILLATSLVATVARIVAKGYN